MSCRFLRTAYWLNALETCCEDSSSTCFQGRNCDEFVAAFYFTGQSGRTQHLWRLLCVPHLNHDANSTSVSRWGALPSSFCWRSLSFLVLVSPWSSTSLASWAFGPVRQQVLRTLASTKLPLHLKQQPIEGCMIWEKDWSQVRYLLFWTHFGVRLVYAFEPRAMVLLAWKTVLLVG